MTDCKLEVYAESKCCMVFIMFSASFPFLLVLLSLVAISAVSRSFEALLIRMISWSADLLAASFFLLHCGSNRSVLSS